MGKAPKSYIVKETTEEDGSLKFGLETQENFSTSESTFHKQMDFQKEPNLREDFKKLLKLIYHQDHENKKIECDCDKRALREEHQIYSISANLHEYKENIFYELTTLLSQDQGSNLIEQFNKLTLPEPFNQLINNKSTIQKEKLNLNNKKKTFGFTTGFQFTPSSSPFENFQKQSNPFQNLFQSEKNQISTQFDNSLNYSNQSNSTFTFETNLTNSKTFNISDNQSPFRSNINLRNNFNTQIDNNSNEEKVNIFGGRIQQGKDTKILSLTTILPDIVRQSNVGKLASELSKKCSIGRAYRMAAQFESTCYYLAMDRDHYNILMKRADEICFMNIDLGNEEIY